MDAILLHQAACPQLRPAHLGAHLPGQHLYMCKRPDRGDTGALRANDGRTARRAVRPEGGVGLAGQVGEGVRDRQAKRRSSRRGEGAGGEDSLSSGLVADGGGEQRPQRAQHTAVGAVQLRAIADGDAALDEAAHACSLGGGKHVRGAGRRPR